MSDGPLRVLVVTEDDPLYVIRFFDVFLEEYPSDRIEVLGITVSKAFHESIWKTAWRVFRFYGLLDFPRLCLRYAMTRLRGRSIASLARGRDISVIETESVNDPAYLERVAALSPDVIMSVSAPEIFREELLDTPRIGCINIHSGRLPIYRGMMPTFWQLLHGESSVVVTIHEMARELDAGGILETIDFPLRERDSLDRVIAGTKQQGARAMIRTLLEIADRDCIEVVPLDMTNASYFSFPKPSDVRAFRALGHRML